MARIEEVTEILADPERVSEWSKAVFVRDGDRVTASPVSLRRGPAVKLVERRGAREETETVSLPDWPERVDALMAAERVHLVTPSADWHARRTRKGRWLVSRGKPSAPSAEPLPAHDRERRYPLPPDDPEARRLFVATGIFSPAGRVRKEYSGKYRQVQHYLELLRPLPVWDTEQPVRVLDAGCGKAYMSLALCAYARSRGGEVELVGVDANAEVVDKVRALAEDLGYSARFETATIWEYARRADDRPDMLVSLHACDTASDEAIAAGVKLGARAIVVAPCCHREIAHQLGRDEELGPLLRHGVLERRFADLLTDALRAALLEREGYRAEVIEFVAAEHTQKNVMIRAVRRETPPTADPGYDTLAARFGVSPTLERLLREEKK